MEKISSTGISPGMALAHLKVILPTEQSEQRAFTDSDTEWSRFKEAQEQAIAELHELAAKAQKDAGDDLASLFETHALMAEDPDFEDAVKDGISLSSLPAETAVLQAGEQLAAFFESMDDEYMRERSADAKDIARRIASALRGEKTDRFTFSSPVILAADDLTPSQTILLDREKVKGFILYHGTPNGHTGILARNLGIPAVVKPEKQFSDADDGKTVFLDGATGEILLEPDCETEANCNARIAAAKAEKQDLSDYKNVETMTPDGRSIKLFCNIGSPADVQEVIENTGEGVGLFRSEFLYLGCDDYPDEETQFSSYAEVLKALKGKEVIIRTCDIGSDKSADYFALPKDSAHTRS